MNRRSILVVMMLALAACGNAPLEGKPTVQPIVRVTPAPTQDVAATAASFAEQSVPTPTPSNIYIVKAGDSLSKIADNNETTIDELMALNNLSDPNKIEIGQVLQLPAPAPEAATTTATP